MSILKNVIMQKIFKSCLPHAEVFISLLLLDVKVQLFVKMYYKEVSYRFYCTLEYIVRVKIPNLFGSRAEDSGTVI